MKKSLWIYQLKKGELEIISAALNNKCKLRSPHTRERVKSSIASKNYTIICMDQLQINDAYRFGSNQMSDH